MDDGPAHFVDAEQGNDTNDGSPRTPWKTIGHAFKQLAPGETLYLRGGRYHESVTARVQGTAAKPVTIRSFPEELAVIDGGLPEFYDAPGEAWQPFAEGAEAEFRSARVYPERAKTDARRDVYVIGHFADSMVPLHGYRHRVDFRSENEFWNIGNKLSTENGVYVGPGLWYDRQTGRIHIRLAHLKADAYAKDRYQGETDPRKVRLIVSGRRTPLRLENAEHLRLQDLVVCGATETALQISGCRDVTLDGVTIYGGSPAVRVEETGNLRLTRCAVRGLSAPWSSRASHKYRGKSPYLLVCGSGNRDFEFDRSEFSDSHDGLFIGTVRGMQFHHNRVENFDDDGVYLNAEGTGGNIRIFQNRFARILSTFSFSGLRDKALGEGVFIYRNILDLRRPTYGWPPRNREADTPGLRPGRVWGDHGSPTWEPMTIYHNTVILPSREFRGYYAAGWGGHTAGTRRRIFNNIFVHLEGMPGLNFPSAERDVQADGNLHWSLQEERPETDFFRSFRQSEVFQASRQHYEPGWAAHDLFADPEFRQIHKNWLRKLDLRLKPESPAIDAGVRLPSTWPDPLRGQDAGRPDIGAYPSGAEPLQTGL